MTIRTRVTALTVDGSRLSALRVVAPPVTGAPRIAGPTEDRP